MSAVTFRASSSWSDIDELAEICDVISLSAGKRGLQMLLAPEEYIRAVKAKVVAITKGEVSSH